MWSFNNIWMPVTWWCWVVRLIWGCYRVVWLIRGCFDWYEDVIDLFYWYEDVINLFCCSDGWRVPSLRPLETLHNALTLRQLEIFIKSLTENPCKTPAPSSSLGTPICVTPGSSQTPSTNLVLPVAAGQSQFKIFLNSKFIFQSMFHSIIRYGTEAKFNYCSRGCRIPASLP